VNNNMLSFTTKKRIFLSVLVFVVLFTVYGLYTHAFVKIELPRQNQNSESYVSIKNQSTKKVLVAQTNKAEYKKLLSSGVYEISITNNTGSFYKIVKIGRFLSTEHVSSSYKPENERTFIGDNPKSCMQTIKNILISVGCGESLNNIAIHKPATDTTPTYKSKPKFESNLGDIEGLIKDNSGRVIVLVKKGLGGLDYYDTSQTYYELGLYNNNLVVSVAKVSNLNPSTVYTLKKSGSKILVANENLSEVYSGDNITSMTKLENIPTAKNSSLLLTSVSLSGQSILATYEKSKPNLVSPEKLTEKSEIVIGGEINSQKSFNQSFVKVDFCKDKICALTHDGILKIYSSELKFENKLTGVKDFYSSENSLLVINKQGIIDFNPDALSGFYSYSFGSYNYEGLQVEGDNSYMVRIKNGKKSYALLINRAVKEKDFVDKKIVSLIKNNYANTVSIYKNHIFVSPELGDLVYNSVSKTLDYSQEARNSAKKSLDKTINKSGINTSKYKIVLIGL